jgi:hypothetical protein
MAGSKIAVLDPIACCNPVRVEVLDESQAELLAGSLAALADPIWYRLVPSRLDALRSVLG